MATVFFARTGTDENRSSHGQQVSIETIVRTLSSYDSKYRAEPPIINAEERPSPYSRYTQTVVEIGKEELCPRFPNAGCYWFYSNRPAECRVILDLPEPPI